MPDESTRPMGPWGKFVALFLGVPPLAVYAAEMDDDEDDESRPTEQPSTQ